ncbi:isopentenyl-diphosphate Delta-isomerase [Schumannella sp. 10F1B-5-1]|uniref:isopentenyl-diphosphate Delta-isomerase n=1 Tax=Schumannella sp. 10F1B-5-1 TaxID=2590780 RepID=UPI0011304B6E|nr:isopentenyl-diphosphate Delta-isomerase [Schumannella sp. 10F1B-5-1]TPW76844.1 isopentenyl-diphosphate Delta-isomerase [Schumannella sp. 10F1B-5-1]
MSPNPAHSAEAQTTLASAESGASLTPAAPLKPAEPVGPELVVLLADDGTPIGTAEKALVHDAATPLHLAFSCHIVDARGRVLITRRALSKRTFAGVWTNSFCGHPAPGESIPEAVRRRAERELGLEIGEPELVLPDFRYRARDAGGVVENEICPVYVARVDADVAPRPAADEVEEWIWVEPDALRTAVEATPFAFSPWIAMQLAEWGDYPAAPGA